ncbi:hypothetical protein D3C87_1088140 [compost metagenome]
MAEALECQNAYISQILNTHANFSLEQALKVAEFLQLKDVETRYFILLVECTRAGTPALQKYFKKDIEATREKYLDIKVRVPEATSLSLENQNVYYSSWLYPTIHMMVTIPDYRTLHKISAALRVDEQVIADVMLFLVSSGLVKESKGSFVPGPTHVHLSKESPHIRQHHANWRISAAHNLTALKENDIHYSTVSSLSNADAEKLKAKLVQVIQDYTEVIAPSKEETLYNFNLDFYSLIKK